MEIAIIGAGNTGQIMAFDLVQKGATVRLYDRNPEKINYLHQKGLEASGKLEGKISLPLATTDLTKAIEGAEIIFVMTTAAGHYPIAKQLKPIIKKDQILIVFNANWGALEFEQVFRSEKSLEGIIIGETGAQLYIGQILEPGKVFSKQIKKEVTLATNHSCDDALKKLAPLIPQFKKAGNIIETSLNNSNPIVHAPVTLFNIARIEAKDDFLFYADGAPEKVIEYIIKIDQERLAIAKKLGIKSHNILEIINSFWPDKINNLYEAIHKNPSYKIAKGPKLLSHRYITEDIPFGIVPLIHLGKSLQIPTPCMNQLVETLNLYLDQNLFTNGFDPSIDEIQKYI